MRKFGLIFVHSWLYSAAQYDVVYNRSTIPRVGAMLSGWEYLTRHMVVDDGRGPRIWAEQRLAYDCELEAFYSPLDGGSIPIQGSRTEVANWLREEVFKLPAVHAKAV